jgi:hypothetical protein
VEVREKHPFDGPIVLRVGNDERTLGERIARSIYVRKISGDTASVGAAATRRGGTDAPADPPEREATP